MFREHPLQSGTGKSRRTTHNPGAIKRSILKLQETVSALFREYPVENIAGFRFSTTVTNMAKAGALLSKLMESLRGERYGITDYVAVKHRHIDDRIHFHVLAGTRCQLRGIRTDTVKRAIREAHETLGPDITYFPHVEEYKRDTSAAGLELKDRIEAAFANPPKGFIKDTHFSTINSEEDAADIGRYLSHYMIHCYSNGKHRDDKGARLWTASQRMSKQSILQGSFTPICDIYGRFSFASAQFRLRLKTFAASRGIAAYEDLANELGKKWFFHYKDQILNTHCAGYYTEALFVKDFGTDFTPEERGIRILDKCYSAQHRTYRYASQASICTGVHPFTAIGSLNPGVLPPLPPLYHLITTLPPNNNSLPLSSAAVLPSMPRGPSPLSACEVAA